MAYSDTIESLKRLKGHVGPTDKTDRKGFVSFVGTLHGGRAREQEGFVSSVSASQGHVQKVLPFLEDFIEKPSGSTARTDKTSSITTFQFSERDTLTELEADLATDMEYPKIKADPALLRQSAESIATTRLVREGKIPEGWSVVFYCPRCGPVFLNPDKPIDLIGCPWCRNREQGLPIPRPPEQNRTADQLTPVERTRWCLEHELTLPGANCPNKRRLDRCTLWIAILQRWPVSKLQFDGIFTAQLVGRD